MPDTTNNASAYGCTEAVCIDANKIYDSCCDRDCLEDLRVYFDATSQAVIDDAISIKSTSAKVLSVQTDVEPVSFNRGYYTVDVTFFFEIKVDAFTSAGTAPTPLTGVATFSKKCILYGSKGNVKTFTSQMVIGDGDSPVITSSNTPIATVQVVDPVLLSSRLVEKCDCTDICCIPEAICSCLGGNIVTDNTKGVFVTLGLFTILQLSRNVQLLIPVFDFCRPVKECNCNTDSPCEIFNKIDFPSDEFFPPESLNCNCNDE